MSPARDAIDIFLMPGEFFVGDAGYRIRTMLGSCVSITLWSRERCIGAMSHFLLSTRGKKGSELDGRYGDEAVLLMIKELCRRGVAPPDCQAKIFGGASMLSGSGADTMHVGHKNGIAARQLMEQLGIPVVSTSLYGNGHRNIIFDVATGDVWARQVNPATLVEPPMRAYT